MVFTWLLSITFPWGKCSSVNVTVKEVVLYLMGDLSTLFFCWFPVLGRVGSVRLVVFSVRLHTSATTIIFSCAVSYRCCSVFSFFLLSFFLIFVSFSALFSVRFHFSRESEEKCVALCSFCCISGGPASAESLKSGFVRRAWVPSQPFGLSFTIWVSDDESASAVRDVDDDDGA